MVPGLPSQVMTHPSARADLLFYVTRKAVMPFLLIPAGVTFVVAVGYGTNRVLGALLGIDHPVLGDPGPVTVLVFTATMLLAYDLSYYLYHTAQHRYPFLWELHKVHHSAEVMVGITKDRVHPLDELMNRVWDEPSQSLERTVDAHIKNLRAKLRAIRPDVDPIVTHRGSGYSLREDL